MESLVYIELILQKAVERKPLGDNYLLSRYDFID
jgi:hypothetical protein